MADFVKDTARDDFQHAKVLTRDAIRSRAYVYPIQGIAYFAAHRALWRPLLSVVAPTLATGLAVTAAMFAFTYVPQATVLALVNGPLAIVTTVLLVLSESSTLLSVLAKAFLIDDALVDTFDATLLARDLSAVVQTERHVKPGSGRDPVAKLGKLVAKPFGKFTPRALVRYLMYLPLNLIPVVGTVLFVLLQGRKAGPAAHARYFQLKQVKRHERDEFIEKRKAAYTSFGVVAFVLELVPVVGVVFAFTNTVGAALWAADMETHQSTAPNLRLQAGLAKKDE